MADGEKRGEALNILLSLSTDKTTLGLISQNEKISKQIVNLAVEDETSNIALQVMINFAQEKALGLQLIKNGAFSVLFDYLSKFHF